METYGLIGKNISYSFSETYFSKKFKKENILNSVYKTFDINEIKDLTSLLEDKNLSGLNVTIPYKESVIQYLDELSPEAKEIGSVNVIKFKEGKLIGYNSDIYGFEKSFKKNLKLIHKKALILGTGGASKAIQYVLTRNNISYKIVSRNNNKGVISYDKLNKEIISEYLIIINCTPLGTFPNTHQKPNIPYKYITNNHYLYDLVYNPPITNFIKEGLNKKSITENGLKMLEQQAEKAWEIWQSK